MKYFSDYLPYAALVADGVMVNKDGSLLRTFEYLPKDYEYTTDVEIKNGYKNINNIFRYLEENWIVYIHFKNQKIQIDYDLFDISAPAIAKEFESLRKKSLGDFYRNKFHLSFIYLPPQKQSISSFMFKSNSNESITEDLNYFLSVTDDVYNLLVSTFRWTKKLNSEDLLTYLHSTFSSQHKVLVPEISCYMDSYLSDVRFKPDLPTRIENEYVLTASIHDFPSESHIGMIKELGKQEIEHDFIMRMDIKSKNESKKIIDSSRKAQAQKLKGVGKLVTEAVLKEESALVDTEALSNVEDASEALSSLSNSIIKYGYLTSTIIVKNKKYNKAEKDLNILKKVLNEKGFITKTETFNNPIAFLGAIPGNIKYNKRSNLISTINTAHFFPISTTWEGTFLNEHLKEVTGIGSPHLIGRSGNSPFYLNLNIGDIGHTLIIGPTGAGKSILLSTLEMEFFRYPNARIIAFDKDKSSFFGCINCGGQFYDLGTNQGYLLNPFHMVSDKSDCVWLSQFLTDYLKSKRIPLSPQDELEIYESLEAMASYPEDQRNFKSFRDTIQNKDIRACLNPFYGDGEYSTLFTSDPEELTNNRFIVFEMNELMKMNKEIVKFVLFYLFYKIEKWVDGKAPVFLPIDECFMFLDDPIFCNRLRYWIKTMRKKNVYIVLSSQEIADFKESSIFSTILNACMTKILLPNSEATQSINLQLYREMGLSDNDIEALSEATPKKEYFYVSPKGKQMFELSLCENQLNLIKSRRAG